MKAHTEITPSCALCETGRLSPDGINVLCVKRGVMKKSDVCRKFCYDPLKRDPKLPKKQKFDRSEFEL